MRNFQVLLLALVSLFAHSVWAEAKIGYTFFLRVSDGVPPITLIATSNYTKRPVSLLRLMPGDIVRTQISAEDYESHFNNSSRYEGRWVRLSFGAQEQLKLWAQPGELIWIDAYRSKLQLRPKQGEARVFGSPELKSWRACAEEKEICVTTIANPDQMEMVDSKVVAGEKPSKWELIYKIHFHAAGVLKEGWVRSADVEQSRVEGIADPHAPALVEDLLAARSDRARVVEGYVPPPPVKSNYHLDFTPEFALFDLSYIDSSSAGHVNSGLGVKLGVQLEAPLAYDFSNNLTVQYGQVLTPQEGAKNHYSQFSMGDEMVYGVGSTEAHFKIGLGGNVLVFNNAPTVSFRALAGGYMAFIYEAEDFFASYRGGLVANTGSGISFANFEMLPAIGWRIKKQRHGLSLVASYSYTQAHLQNAPDKMKFAVLSLGLASGF